ncbi:hypothetical protein WR25_09782 [Diploscapter pachys]|uniref:Uncharacterized protein n=1 Tax=Diploscapter pachys TaxID=2018661 RepID=A0A2A2M3L3_9BILA|nr:hypothetical protein WR25_09782 [Diploscapter pachys]
MALHRRPPDRLGRFEQRLAAIGANDVAELRAQEAHVGVVGDRRKRSGVDIGHARMLRCGRDRPLPQIPRHPGLVPGATEPQGGGKSLQPPPSPQSGPRTKSGVTAWVGGLTTPLLRPRPLVAQRIAQHRRGRLRRGGSAGVAGGAPFAFLFRRHRAVVVEVHLVEAAHRALAPFDLADHAVLVAVQPHQAAVLARQLGGVDAVVAVAVQAAEALVHRGREIDTAGHGGRHEAGRIGDRIRLRRFLLALLAARAQQGHRKDQRCRHSVSPQLSSPLMLPAQHPSRASRAMCRADSWAERRGHVPEGASWSGGSARHTAACPLASACARPS